MQAGINMALNYIEKSPLIYIIHTQKGLIGTREKKENTGKNKKNERDIRTWKKHRFTYSGIYMVGRDGNLTSKKVG
jgi:hypothetical protein